MRCVTQVRTGLSLGPQNVCWGLTSTPPGAGSDLDDARRQGGWSQAQASVQSSLGLTPVSLSNFTGLVPSKSEPVCMCGLTPVPQHWVQRLSLPHLYSVSAKLITLHQVLQALRASPPRHLPPTSDPEYQSSLNWENLNGMGDAPSSSLTGMPRKHLGIINLQPCKLLH